MEEDGVNFGMIGKREERPDGERDGSGSALGSGLSDWFSSRYEEQPPKFVRTDTFPCRMLNSVDAAATREERPDGERDGSGSALGSGLSDWFSSRYEEQPPKFVRTDTFPCRMLNSVDAAATGGFNVIPSLYPSSGANIINSDGPTAFFYNPRGGGICDASFVKDSIKSQAAMGMSGSGSFVGMNHFRYPHFTPTQWQELKRQVLIYKHFVSFSPIPADLLSDPSRALSTIPPPYPNLGRTGVGGGGYFNLQFTNKTDPEPGRCRRTDGKKWRCSRDAAPDQKYCERHLHRGRLRSRKPVEQRQRTTTTVPAADAPLFLKSTATAVSKIVDSPKITTSVVPTTAVSHFNVAMTKPSSRGQDSPGGIGFSFLSMVPEKEPRYSDWMRGGGDLEEMHSCNHPLLHQYEEHPNPIYSNQNDPCYTFLNPTLSMDEYQTQDHLSYPPRSFIDAWSNEKPTTGIMSSSPPSHLTLSISNNANDSSTLQIQMGLGITDFDLGKSHSLSWMNNAAACGPLSEVLQSGTATPSPHNSNDDGDGAISGSTYAGLGNLKGRRPAEVNSPPQVVVSSPTGVLQRTFVSLSDSSTNSSPTFAVGSRRSEMGGLPWMSLAK